AIAPRLQLPFPCPRSNVDGPWTCLTGRAPCLRGRPSRVYVEHRLLYLHLAVNLRLQPPNPCDNLSLSRTRVTSGMWVGDQSLGSRTAFSSSHPHSSA